jgi:hypothetical protein
MKTKTNLLSAERIVTFLAGAFFTIMVNVISNWLSDKGGRYIYLIFIIGTIVGAIALAVASRRKRYLVKAIIGNPISLDANTIRQGYARKGLIAFISLYNPIKDNNFEGLSKEERDARMAMIKQAAKDKNFTLLDGLIDPAKSNFEPLLKAIASHQSVLKHCWFISTAGENGSNIYLPYLEHYIRVKMGIQEEQCKFDYGLPYQISADRINDIEIVERTRKLVDLIYTEASEQYHLEESDVIADMTSGFRSMPLGMILACLDETRDIEFVGTQYGDAAKPFGELHPMIFHFETRITEEKK